MAGTPLVKKLGIRPGREILVNNAPEGYLESLEPLPEGARVGTESEDPFDFVQTLVRNKTEVDSSADKAIASPKPVGLLWFSYSKKSWKVVMDITLDVGWDAPSGGGLLPVTQMAIYDIWSAMRFRPIAEIKSRRPGANVKKAFFLDLPLISRMPS